MAIEMINRRNATLVKKVHHCRFTINIEGVGQRDITTGTCDAAAIEAGDSFTVDWFPKGQCWIPFVPTAVEVM